jgi:MurNAc alpha-1-phosphate uridylyltransferase
MQPGQHLPLMVFAAGFGTRMGALTQSRPKPLIKVAGRALIDHALALADAAQAQPVVVNLHYLGDQIAAHLANRPKVGLSWERDLILETGGGLRAALPLLDTPEVAMTLNSDSVWDGPNPLALLQKTWDPAAMDALLLLAPLARCLGREGGGDFTFDPATGSIARGRGDPTALVYLGAQIIKTGMLDQVSEQVFSLNRLWDIAIAAGRARAVVYPGRWCDVGHPAGITSAEAMIAPDTRAP